MNQVPFTYSELTIETAEHVWNMFKVNYKDTRTTSLALFWCLYCSFWTDFTHCSAVSIVEFEQINASKTEKTKWHLTTMDCFIKVNFFIRSKLLNHLLTSRILGQMLHASNRSMLIYWKIIFNKKAEFLKQN